MTDLLKIAGDLLRVASLDSTDVAHSEHIQDIRVRLRNAHDVLQKVTGGVAARQQNRRFWAALDQHGVPTAEVSASPRLLHPLKAFDMYPTPRAVRYALKALREDFEPRGIPYSELLALRRFLEAQLPEETRERPSRRPGSVACWRPWPASGSPRSKCSSDSGCP